MHIAYIVEVYRIVTFNANTQSVPLYYYRRRPAAVPSELLLLLVDNLEHLNLKVEGACAAARRQ